MSVLKQIKRTVSNLLDLLLPHSPESVIARALSEETLTGMMKPVAHANEPWIIALFSYYDPKARALVKSIKYRSEEGPLPALGRVVAREVMKVIAEKRERNGWRDILIVPMPSSPSRLRWRGYNQSERIALSILPHLTEKIEYAPDVLGRADRKSQVKVSKERRHRNIHGAFFALRPEKIRGRCILIIDDVVETGATLKEARYALLEVGAIDVAALVVAH
ncbi:MAG: phosphoribosyltransferase family protein [Patescibacteria group bacterium]